MGLWGEVLQLLLQGCSGSWLVQPICAHLERRKFFGLGSHQFREITPALEWCLVVLLETENSATDGLPPSFTSFLILLCLENSLSFASTPLRSPCTGDAPGPWALPARGLQELGLEFEEQLRFCF